MHQSLLMKRLNSYLNCIQVLEILKLLNYLIESPQNSVNLLIFWFICQLKHEILFDSKFDAFPNIATIAIVFSAPHP